MNARNESIEVLEGNVAEAPARRRFGMKRVLVWSVAAVVLVAGGAYAYEHWRFAEAHVSTDNAYVNANKLDVSTEVSGPVSRVLVANNQHVKAGELLFEIDPRPYGLAVDRARAQVDLARQGVGQSSAGVAAATAQVAQRQAELANAETTFHRNEQLVEQHFLSPQALDNSRTAMNTARAAVAAAEANLAQAKSALGSVGDANANVRAAEAALGQAELDLAHTAVRAPANGTVANLSLRPGQAVQARTPLFALIGDDEFWVDANFKETELEGVRAGEPATVVLDLYPDHPFHGVVESLSGGAGTVFSLLPPQNATGNWVKVTQRVPVRVHITDPDPRYPLRIGTTASVTVDLARR